jgi:DNA-binding MarR family transcriptional regulator
MRSPSTRDRRRSHLELTAAGVKVYSEVAPFARAYEQELLEPLSRTERAALDHLLRVLLGRATEIGPAHARA